MRAYARHTTYKGLPIIIRWFEVARGESWGPGTRRYAGSYLVESPDAAFGVWQVLREDVFASYEDAAEHALAVARRAINTSFAAAGLSARTRLSDANSASSSARG